MTNKPTPRSQTAQDLRDELTAALRQRFGAARAAALETEIAGAAETLAEVAAVSMLANAHEPDYIGSLSEVRS
ncbi:MAG TPA: hypothetical protein VFZ25_07965 [Chloroflexota bacterium]|nr:hypothetical protein [Chloroflexota bacterium]